LLASRPVTFAIFPADDRLFASFVQRAYEQLVGDGAPTPEALQRALRTYHTRAVVRPQASLAGFGDGEVWYAYRDGRPGGRAADEWWLDPSVGHVRFSDDGRYLEANDEACRLVGLPPGGLVGLSLFDVVVPGGREAMEAVANAEFQRTGAIHSVFDCRLPDGSMRVIEYRSRRTDEPGVNESAWREIALIEAPAPPAE
jgi:PAS domain S-box-containing protein